MVDVEVRARTLPPPRYPHSSVLTSAPGTHHVVYLLGESAERFVIAEGRGVKVLAAGGALTAERVRRRFTDFAASFAWDRLDDAVRTLKSEAATSFLVSIVATDRIVVFGDMHGSIPIYHSADGRVIATNPDAVGHAVGAAYDAVSFADMSATKRICFPYTLYEGVRQVSPTAYVDLDGGGFAVRESGWRPPMLMSSQVVESAAATLERSLADHVDGRRAVVAISGGLDSRVIASLATRFATTQSFSITEKPSRDATIGALAAQHRGIPHENIVLQGRDFRRVATRVAQSATSQNLAAHAHFAPIGERMMRAGAVLVTGYGANANFERYDSLEKLVAKIDDAGFTPDMAAELKRRWAAHADHVRDVLGLDPRHVAPAWPSTQKKAFAFVPSNRAMMPTFDPFVLMPEMFSAKALVGRDPSNLATKLFRTFCADETHLPTTRMRHPLGVAIEADPSAAQKDAGWPSKASMFRFAEGRKGSPALGALHPTDSGYFRQICAVEAVWSDDPSAFGFGSFARRLLRRLFG